LSAKHNVYQNKLASDSGYGMLQKGKSRLGAVNIFKPRLDPVLEIWVLISRKLESRDPIFKLLVCSLWLILVEKISTFIVQ